MRFGVTRCRGLVLFGVLLLFAAEEVAAKAKFKDYWNKFCGLTDCYSELGLYPNATKIQIKRAYRNLSLEYHPDKNPGNRVAAEKFRRVARANEVLSSDEERKKLDYYTENPGEYFQLYGSYVEMAYAPKSSVVTVMLFLLAFTSCVMYVLQKSKHDQFVAKLERAATLKLPVTGGGTVESLELRRRADELAAKSSKSKKVQKEELKKAIKQLVRDYSNDEFPEPKFSELPVVKLFTLPYSYISTFVLAAKIEYKKFKNLDLSDDEKQIVIEKYLGGPDKWEALTDEQQDYLIANDCAVKANFNAWIKDHPDLLDQKNTKPNGSSSHAETTTNANGGGANLTTKAKRELRQRRKQQASFVIDD